MVDLDLGIVIATTASIRTVGRLQIRRITGLMCTTPRLLERDHGFATAESFWRPTAGPP
jgi:hypothetical protein